MSDGFCHSLEQRCLLAGNVLVMSTNWGAGAVIKEYSSTWVDQGRSVTVPAPLWGTGRGTDIAVDSQGRVFTTQYNEYCYLSTYENGAWTHRTLTGWDAAYNVPWCVCVIGNRAYSTDYGADANPSGIVYFNTTGGPGARIAGPNYTDLSPGPNGQLYALRANRMVDVYDTSTLSIVRTITLASSTDPLVFGVDATGNIYGAFLNRVITKYDSNGAVIGSSNLGALRPYDLDVADTGELLFADSWGRPMIVDLTTNTVRSLASSAPELNYAAWGSLVIPTTPGTITGSVIRDQNGNGTLEAGETGVSGKVVYTDLNRNGVLDAGEISTTTDSTGNYTLSVPAGNYNIAMQIPDGWKTTLNTTSFPTAVTAGQTVALNPFMINAWVENPSLDAGYGVNGRTTAFVNSSGMLSDGRMIVASVQSNKIAFDRYTANGHLDLTFGANGRVTTTLTNGWPLQIADAGNGKFLMAFDSYDNNSPDMQLIRFNANGSMDSTFGNAGIASMPSNMDRTIAAFTVSFDGSITAASKIGRFVRYTPSGVPDSTFGTNGFFDVGLGNIEVRDLETGFDGSVYFCGKRYVGDEMYSRAFVLHYLRNGTRDTNFGGAEQIHEYGVDYGPSTFEDIELLPDGKMLISGYEHLTDGVVIRLTFDGLPDMQFGSGGRALLQITTPQAVNFHITEYVHLAVAPDGSIYAATTARATSWCGADVIIEKLTPRGLVDTSFNGRGQAILSMSTGGDFIDSFSLHPDGGLLVASWSGTIAKVQTSPAGNSSISGVVWEDEDANGAIDRNERTFPGRNVYLDLNNNAALDWNEPHVVSDCFGRYAFGSLVAGDYAVRVEPRPDSLNTSPGAQNVTLAANATISGKNFSASVDAAHAVISYALDRRFGAPRLVVQTDPISPPSLYDFLAPYLSVLNLDTNALYFPISLTWNAESTKQYYDLPPEMPLGKYVVLSSNSTPYAFVDDGRPYVDSFCTPVDLLYGDANGDRKVNTADFNLLAGSFGKIFPTAMESAGDFNLDRWVDSRDFAIFVACYGTNLNSAAVYPPSAAHIFSSPAHVRFGIEEILA